MRVARMSTARSVGLAGILVAAFVITGFVTPASSNAARPASRALGVVSLQPGRVAVIPDLTYAVADGMPLRLDICMPAMGADTAEPLRPAIVSIHGGSWRVGDKAETDWRNVCVWLASAGYVVASVDYRLAPKYVFPDQIVDVEHAVEWLRAPAQASRFRLDPTLIGAFGGSAGGNLAALLGTTGSGSLAVGHRVAAVAELSGPADLTAAGAEQSFFVPRVLSYLGCSSYASCPQAVLASPIAQVDATDPPFFIGNSSDELIPFSQSETFSQRLKAAGVPVTLVRVPGTLHSISMLDETLRDRIAAFFRSTLVRRPTAPK